jgi:quercetin dioxygenase-like cupin family protein
MTSRRGSEKEFVGTAWIHELLADSIKVYLVFFEPEARTNWHWHHEGQTLYVVAGQGRVVSQDDAGEHAYEIGPGDIVHIGREEKHWHGAAPNTIMIHIAITPNTKGESTNWKEKVTDEEYRRGFD